MNTAGAFALSLVAEALASVGIALHASLATGFALATIVADLVGIVAGLAGMGGREGLFATSLLTDAFVAEPEIYQGLTIGI